MKKMVLIVVGLLMSTINIFHPESVLAEDSTIDLSSIDSIAESSIDDGVTPGVTVLVKKGDYTLYHESFGWSYLYDMGEKLENPISASNDTLYDLASVTKVMATTQAIMKLYYEGKIDLDKPVSEYLDGFGTKGKEKITARDLLTHTSGLPQWEPTFLTVNTRKGEKEYINDLEMMFEPGTYHYSDFSFMILAFIVEEITNQPIEGYLRENIYGPLNMNDTMFVPVKNGVNPDRIAATSWGNPYEWRMSNQRDWNVGYDTTEFQEAFDQFDGWREHTLIGEVNDGNAGMANEGVAGHAGLYSTASDLSILGDIMLNGGEKNGTRIYDQETIDMFTKEQSGVAKQGLGWKVGPSEIGTGFVGDYATKNTFAHDGFTGTQVVFHKDYDLQVIVLSNKQNYGPYNDNGSYHSTFKLSRDVNNAVFEAILADIVNVDKTELNNLINEANEKEKSNYTEETWGIFAETLAETKELLNKENVIQLEVDTIYEKLLNAMDNLVSIGDKTKLVGLVEIVKDLDINNLTKNSKERLEEAIKVARSVLENPDATQSEIDEALESLQNAYNSIEYLINKEELIELIKKAEKIDLTDKTDESIEIFSKALEKAKDIRDNDSATQSEVNGVISELKSAINSLELVVINDDEKEPSDKEESSKDDKNLPQTGEQSGQWLSIGAFLIVIGSLFMSKIYKADTK